MKKSMPPTALERNEPQQKHLAASFYLSVCLCITSSDASSILKLTTSVTRISSKQIFISHFKAKH